MDQDRSRVTKTPVRMAAVPVSCPPVIGSPSHRYPTIIATMGVRLLYIAVRELPMRCTAVYQIM